MVTFDYALDTVMQLPQEEQENLIEIVKKRLSDEWRKETANYYHDIKLSIANGDLKPTMAKEAIEELHSCLTISD